MGTILASIGPRFIDNAVYAVISKPLYILRAHRLRRWRFGDLDLLILPGVTHPGDKKVSRATLQYLQSLDIAGNSFLELGSGAGSQSCLAAFKGARAYASDIVETACHNVQINAERNELDVAVYHSDLFDGIPQTLTFDLVTSIPPIIPRYPEDSLDFAYCCGENFEYFVGLFEKLSAHLTSSGRLLMPLPTDRIGSIVLAISEEHGFRYRELRRIRHFITFSILYEFTPRENILAR